MSEILGNRVNRVNILKAQIRRLHEGNAPEEVKTELQTLLGQIPYDEVVQAEQELIAEGLPQEEVIKLCDVHTAVLKGALEQEGKIKTPPGHPVHTFIQENLALNLKISELESMYNSLQADGAEKPESILDRFRTMFNELMDVDKHYRRKEYLLFPFLEKHGVTAPPKVMWAKHDETRALLKRAHDALAEAKGKDPAYLKDSLVPALKSASDSVNEMIYKENQILLPMSLDLLTPDDWSDVYHQSVEIGFCLYDPVDEWKSATRQSSEAEGASGRINLPTGSMTLKELEAVLNSLPVDITFVDAKDTVRYFSHGRERIFDRNRAILGRKVQMCHPPSSVDTVEQILEDFRSGKESSSAFWISLKGRFIHIEYFALRDDTGAYLGTLEVSQDLTEKRKLEGEQRLLSYGKRKQQ